MGKWWNIAWAVGAIVVAASAGDVAAHPATTPTTTTSPGAPEATDLAAASVEGSYRLSIVLTEQEGVRESNAIGVPFVLGLPLVLAASGQASFIYPTTTYTRDGATVTVSGSDTTDCYGDDGSVSIQDGADSTVTLNLNVASAIEVGGTWSATQLSGSGELVNTARSTGNCSGFQRFDITAFRLDPPDMEVADLVTPDEAIGGTAQAATTATLDNGGATASLQLVIDPELADPFVSRTVTATVVVRGAWYTRATSAPVPGANLLSIDSSGLNLVCGATGPFELDPPAPFSFSLVFADEASYADASAVPAAIGDLNQQVAIPYQGTGPLFREPVTPTAPYKETATITGCTSTIVYDFVGTITLLDNLRVGSYHVVPSGINIPFLGADGQSETLPFTKSDLPIIEVTNQPVPTTTIVATTTTTVATTTSAPTSASSPAVLAANEANDGGGSAAPIAIGALALVGLAGGGAQYLRSRQRRRRDSQDERHDSPTNPPKVRVVPDKGRQRITSFGGGLAVGVRAVLRQPGTTSLRWTGETRDNE